MKSKDQQSMEFEVFVGIDWADRKHVGHIITGNGKKRGFELDQTPSAIANWVQSMIKQFGRGRIAVCLEQSRGALVAALMKYRNLVLFPVNPKQLARFREAMNPSGSKDDPTDAELLAELVLQHRSHLRAWVPDDALTRQIGRCTESRRKLVDDRKRLSQRLRQLLKEYYPLAVEMFEECLTSKMARDFLMRWPTMAKAKRAHPKYLRKFFQEHNCRSQEKIQARIDRIRKAEPLTTDEAIVAPAVLMVKAIVEQLRALEKAIKAFDEEIAILFNRHEDAGVFKSLPGAGPALAPRLLAAMGTDRNRFENAEAIQSYSGIAPVTKKSGRTQIIHRRYACPKFIRQTFHEFAEKSIPHSEWAHAFYQRLRSRGKKHNAAVRALAFKWIRIINRLWRSRQTYDERRYIQTLRKRNSPIIETLHTT